MNPYEEAEAHYEERRKKYTSFDEEIERYESRGDILAIIFIVLTVVVACILIATHPDSEAIGTWISSHIN